MRRCKAISDWTVILLAYFLLSAVCGCTIFDREDPMSSYTLPGDVDPNRGVLTKLADSMKATTRESIGLGPNEQAAKEMFDEATNIYESAKLMQGREAHDAYDKAARMFNRAASRWPNSSVEEDAKFFKAESHYFANRYPKAEAVFAELLNKYQSTKYLDLISQRRFEIAKYWLDHQTEVRQEWSIAPNFTSRERPTFDKFGNAIKILEQIRLDDPTGEFADDATMLAATACFQAGKIFRADELFADLRRSFPSSTHQYNAHLLGLKCKIKLYQGPSYDAGPLNDAGKLVDQMKRVFPKESAEDAEFLTAAYKEVRMNKAIRDYRMAEYRERRDENRAAKIQYERVANEYRDTSLSVKAESQLSKLKGQPDLPPKRLAWLEKAFPSEGKQVTPLLR